MIRRLSLHFILAITLSFVIAFEDYVENPDYEHLKSQFMNLQAAQRNINKKSDSIPTLSQAQVRSSLSELRQDYSKVDNWPTERRKLGAISAVALDVYKNVVVFHRDDRIWNSETFDLTTNVFKKRNLGAITDNTIVTFDRESGNVVSEWGKNLFYMPHGLHINGNYYYVTDVGLHQVFRFNIKNSTTKPELILGEAFKPGKSAKLFCKPTSVASLDNGDFFVADGYCNSRILKFNFNGEKILEWGKSSFSGPALHSVEPPMYFAVPHALTLVPEKELVCVADRENGRIQCFSSSDGQFVSQYHSPVVGDRLFSVDYANGSLFVVNGPERTSVEIRGYTFDIVSGEVTSKFGEFKDPHDIAVTSDAKEVYVADLSPDIDGHRIHKFLLNGQKPTRTSGDSSNPVAPMSVQRGDTALLVGSIMLIFVFITIGIACLISRKQQRGERKHYVRKPWDKSTQNIFFDYNQFEKIPQNDDESLNEQNEFA